MSPASGARKPSRSHYVFSLQFLVPTTCSHCNFPFSLRVVTAISRSLRVPTAISRSHYVFPLQFPVPTIRVLIAISRFHCTCSYCNFSFSLYCTCSHCNFSFSLYCTCSHCNFSFPLHAFQVQYVFL